MKKFFNKPVSEIIRDEINDLRGRPSASNTHATGTRPTYNHYPNLEKPETDSYSHTAASTAGYSQNRTYPNLPNFRKEAMVESVSSSATDLVSSLVGPDLAVSVTNAFNGVVSSGVSAREVLRSGVMVQLLSKSSGRLLQIVMTPEGSLAFDGNGSQSAFNTVFIVEEGEKGRVRFHNNCNFLAYDGKHPCVLSMPLGPKNNPSIEFRAHEVIGNRDLICLESCVGKNYFISVSNDGFLKRDNTKSKNIEAHFSVIILPQHPYAPYPMAAQPSFTPQTSQYFAPSAPPPPPSYEEANSNRTTQPTSGGLYPQFQ